MLDLIIKGGLLVNHTQSLQANIAIKNGKIGSIFTGEKNNLKAEKVIDATGKLVFPGIVDTHVHFQLQDLGKIISTDTFASGTQAAAFGGVTTIIDFADQTRGESPLKCFRERKNNAHGQMAIDYSLHVSKTDLEYLDEIPALIKEGVTSFKFFTTYSWRKLDLNDYDLLKFFKEIRKNRAMVMGHCENDIMVQKGRQELIEQNKKDPIFHALSRPHIVEEEAIQRIILFAKRAKVRLHIAHITTKEGSDLLLQAKQAGLSISGETCPHYLLLNEGAYKGKDGYLNLMSPPLRHTKDQQALLNSLKNKNIDQIITDHCEFSRESKGNGKLPFDKVTNGVPGIETSLPLMHDLLVNKNNFSYPELVNLMSTNPAKNFGLYPQKGSLEIGTDADLVIFDPKLEKTITPETLHYNIDWNPYTGKNVTGWPVMTILRGQVLTDHDTFVGSKTNGKFVRRSLIK
ncbi:MAG: dihydropyrimidinase [Candidatus Hodarchaeales archaeon]